MNNLIDMCNSNMPSIRDDTNMTSLLSPVFKTPIPLVHVRPKFFNPLKLGRPISNEPFLQLINN